MYHLIKNLLFLLPAERAHYFTLHTLRLLLKFPGVKSLIKSRYQINHPALRRNVFGIDFPNPVGLAAGFDKNAAYMSELQLFGFGFIEIGTLTPVGQPGNPKPRLFRIPADKALINRLGFNNEGVAVAIEKLKKRPKGLIVGGNIGKNKHTPNEQATEDYRKCFEALFPYVDYFVVNVSSPNTPDLRSLQEKEPLKQLLSELQRLNMAKPAPKPILLKIAPDLNETQLDEILEIVSATQTAGIIATNTTISREGLSVSQEQIQQIGQGGLSGKPLKDKSTAIIRYLRTKNNSIPIIGVGGIVSGKDAVEKLEAGADLVQLYTGFIYGGPGIVKQINKAILQSLDHA